MMLMMDHLGAELQNWKPILLATDISATALKKAMAGGYEAERVAELPADLRNQYFRPHRTGECQVTGPVRERIHLPSAQPDGRHVPLQEAVRRHLLP